MKKLWIAAAGCVLLLIAARESEALWVACDVTPAEPTVFERKFSVTAEPVESLQKIRVTVTPTGKKLLSPYLSGYLWMHDGEHFLGEIAVEEQRQGSSSSFSMKLDPKIARNSHFELQEGIYIWKKGETTRPSRDEPRGIRLMGGHMFRLKLGEFLKP